MSREVSGAEEALKAVLGTALGIGASVCVATFSALLAEHLKRKFDMGLVSLPWRPEHPIYLGGLPPGAPPRLAPVPARPLPGPINGGGLVDLLSPPPLN